MMFLPISGNTLIYVFTFMVIYSSYGDSSFNGLEWLGPFESMTFLYITSLAINFKQSLV